MRPDIVVYYYYPKSFYPVYRYWPEEDPEWYSMATFNCHESLRVFDWGDTYK